MNILLISGAYSRLSVPFIQEFALILPKDQLMVFILSPFSQGASVYRIIKRNRLGYLFGKVLQLADMKCRSLLSGLLPLRPKYLHELVADKQLRYFEVTDINARGIIETVRRNNIDIMITYDCNQILKKDIIRAPRIVSLNVHSSLLPRYRGPAPIYWVVKNREMETGISVHLISEEIDKGDIIIQNKLEIKPGTGVGRLSKSLAMLGAKSIQQAIEAYRSGTVFPMQQNQEQASYYSNTGRIY